jgi:predicted alpha/beta hydrolase family esterase
MDDIILLPGYGGSYETHWQQIWAQADPSLRFFAPASWDRPERSDWVAALDRAIEASPRPPVLVAHSLSCLLVAHWSRVSRARIAGAILVAVPDPHSGCFPEAAAEFADVSSTILRFQTLILASENDPHGSAAYARRRAAEWGAGLIELGAVGHINGASGLGAWPEGLRLVLAFRAGAQRVSTTETSICRADTVQ